MDKFKELEADSEDSDKALRDILPGGSSQCANISIDMKNEELESKFQSTTDIFKYTGA
jgi:hypothetical protein